MGRNCAEATKALFRRRTRSVAALVAAAVRPTAPLTAEALAFTFVAVRECRAAAFFVETDFGAVFFAVVLFTEVLALPAASVAVARAEVVWAEATCPAPNANININPLLIDTLNSTSPTRHHKNRHNASIDFICVQRAVHCEVFNCPPANPLIYLCCMAHVCVRRDNSLFELHSAIAPALSAS